MPYLPIDPKDLGRTYEAVIRVNSQSGKGGVAYVIKADHGLDLPRALQIEFSRVVQEVADRTGKELTSADIWSLFEETYLGRGGIRLVDYSLLPEPRPGERRIVATIAADGAERRIEGVGNGPIAAFVDALKAGLRDRADCARLPRERSRRRRRRAGRRLCPDPQHRPREPTGLTTTLYGVGMDNDIVTASLKAVASAAQPDHATHPRPLTHRTPLPPPAGEG